MYDSVRVPCLGRPDSLAYRSETSRQHHRYAASDVLFADGVGQAPVGERHIGFSGQQHGVLFRPARRGADVVLRRNRSGVLAYRHRNGSQYGFGIGRDGTCTSMGKKTWSI